MFIPLDIGRRSFACGAYELLQGKVKSLSCTYHFVKLFQFKSQNVKVLYFGLVCPEFCQEYLLTDIVKCVFSITNLQNGIQ